MHIMEVNNNDKISHKQLILRKSVHIHFHVFKKLFHIKWDSGKSNLSMNEYK